MRELQKRGGKTLVIAMTVVVAGLLLAASAAGVAYKASEHTVLPESSSSRLLMKTASTTPITLTKNTPGMHPILQGADLQLTAEPGSEQHPDITSDGATNIVAMYENDVEGEMPILFSADGGLSWFGGVFEDVNLGYATHPRIDFYEGTTAYATITLDQGTEEFGYTRYFIIEDMVSDPTATGVTVAWSDTYEYGPFTSTDVACYVGENAPNDDFYGVLGVTGDSPQAPNDLCVQWSEPGDMSVIYTIGSTALDYFNVSADIDPSTSVIVLAADYIKPTDSENWGVQLKVNTEMAPDDEYWYQAYRTKTFKYSAHPSVASGNGRVYVATELEADDGTTDIVCHTTTDPDNIGSWETYMVTQTPGVSERFPAITATSDNDAAIVYTQGNNLYATGSMDGGLTWTAGVRVNDDDGTVVEQYGTTEIELGNTIWTDTRAGNNDIYFDETGITFPIITIQEISGGLLGASMVVENIGTGDATDVPWSIDLEGGIILAGEHTEGVIPSLAASASTTVKTSLVLGLGPATLTAVAGGVRQTADVTILLIFVLA